MSNERLKEVLYNLIDWAGEHSEEFYECFVDAMCLEKSELEELRIWDI